MKTTRKASKPARAADNGALQIWARKTLQQHAGTELHEAAIWLATAQICQVLRDFDPAVLKDKLGEGDPGHYVKLLAILLQLSDGEMKYEKYRAEVAEKKAQMQEALNGGESGMTPQQMAEFRQLLDQL